MNPYSDGHVLRIRLFRIRHGITLRELSAQSGITVQRINCIERMEFSLTLRSRERILCALELYCTAVFKIPPLHCGTSNVSARDYLML